MNIERTTDSKLGVILSVVLALSLIGIISIVITEFIGALVLAVFLYYASRPLFRKLTDIAGNGALNAALTLILFSIPFVLTTYYTILTASREIQQAVFQYELYELQPYIEPYIDFQIIQVIETPEVLFSEAEGIELIQGLLDYVLVLSSVIGKTLLLGIVTLTVSFYLLKDDDRLRGWADEQFSIVSNDFADFADIIDTELSNIYFGNILNAVFTVVISITVFSLYNIVAPAEVSIVFPVLLAVLAGIFSLIPLVGTKPAYLPATAYLISIIYFGNLDPQLYIYPISFLIVSGVIVDFIPDMFLRPYVSGRNIHIGLLLISYIAGSQVLGWYGFFLFPIFAVLAQNYFTLIFPKLVRRLNTIELS